MSKKYIAWFDEIGKEDINIVGGKGANLGEMIRAKIPVPFGFVVTAGAYYDFLKETGIEKEIRNFIGLMDRKDSRNLQTTSENIQRTIIKARMPEPIAKEIMSAYLNIGSRAKKHTSFHNKLSSMMNEPYVAVRSSATAEDLPDASFAGQQATYLNVKGEANVVKKVKEAWASLFTSRAIFYREEQKFDHFKVGIAVPVQIMINSATSGVMFTIDPVTNDKNKVIVEAIYGLGEFMVQGAVTPDHFEISKKTGKIEAKKVSYQSKKMVRENGVNKVLKLNKNAGSSQKITEFQAQEIAAIGLKLEKHYYFPQDVEWAIENGNIYIVQTRPVTTIKATTSKNAALKDFVNKLPFLLKGDPASPGIASGPVKNISSARDIDKVLAGDILVTSQTNPDFVPAMKRAVAIVTERGGRTSHAAIVSRELGIPAIVGAEGATKKLTTGMVITVNGAKGEVYKGGLSDTDKAALISSTAPKQYIQRKTATKVYVNLATPGRITEVAKMNVDGIGLLRAEFMIADIGTHPKKLIKEHKEKIFINKLAEDLVKFCKEFNPRPVVYRATDFKTNEYRNLIGGKDYEPEEANPMLGYRGAYRYIADPAVFNLELEAIKMVRNKFGLKNLWLMLPFVRNVKNLIEVKKIIAASGLSRSGSFKLWMMVEIPSNVILLEQFCEVGIDGVSIGSNDLTMLILGVDRDNTEVASEFDEMNDATMWAFERVAKVCKKYGVTVSMCGQAPSDYPLLVEKMVEWGATSMSVNADAVDHVRETIFHAESRLVMKKSK